jgi:hypothetical protein
MENKYLMAGKREAIFILKNENKTYAEFVSHMVKCLLYSEKFRTHIIFQYNRRTSTDPGPSPK